MFKKLRNRMLLMHLSMISIMMLVSFTALYIITSSNIHKTIDESLYRISDFKKNDRFITDINPVFPPMIPADIPQYDPKEDPKGDPVDQEKSEDNQEIFDQRLNGFVIVTDSEYTMVNWITFFKTDDTFLEQALTQVKQIDDTRGEFDLDDSRWAFLVKERAEGYVISFVDINTQYKVLQRLILTFVIVSIAMLGFIVGISFFLTERSIKPIKEAFGKQKQFISDASHELRTPLAVIRTNVDVLLTHQGTDQEKWLHYIKDEVDRMAHLTSDLLYLTQMEDEQSLKPLKSTFNLSEKIEHLLLGVEVAAFEKHLTLEYDLRPEAMVHGNPEQISQVVMILLDNALKYTTEKGHIMLKLTKSTHHYVISVANTSEGIKPEDMPHIFERFYRGDKSRHRENGSYGLGLSIAKSIVENHGGKITCENLEHGYTEFTVKLRIS